MTRPTCYVQTCDRTTTAGLCTPHRGNLIQLLDNLPDLLDELTTQVTRQSRYSTGSSHGKSTTPALLFDVVSADAERKLMATIRQWDIAIADHVGIPVRHPNPITAARFIRQALTTGRLDNWPPSAVLLDALEQAATDVAKLIDQPQAGQTVGLCGNTIETTDSDGRITARECTQRLRADEGQDFITCRTCGAVHSVADQHTTLLTKADEQIMMASEAARALNAYWGIDFKLKNFQIMVSKWNASGRLPRKGTAKDVNGVDRPTYRLGDIRDLVTSRDTRAPRSR